MIQQRLRHTDLVEAGIKAMGLWTGYVHTHIYTPHTEVKKNKQYQN